jgi:hypothetical protein
MLTVPEQKTRTATSGEAPRTHRRASAISQALGAIARVEPGEARTRAPAAAIEIRQAGSASELEEVYRLTHDAYVEREYCRPRPDGRLVHYPHLEGIPETIVLIALLDGRVVGSVSVTLDGPRGLHVDQDFGDTCDAVRREGVRVCAAWRIVTRRSLRGERRVVMALIKATFSTAFGRLACRAMLCSFNPRHEGFYRRACGMETIARRDSTRGLYNAPAVLMRVDADRLPERWR